VVDEAVTVEAAVAPSGASSEADLTAPDAAAPTLTTTKRRRIATKSSEGTPAGTDAEPGPVDTGTPDDVSGAVVALMPETEARTKVRWYCVQKHLHLGLNLRVGAIYAEGDLRKRCGGDQGKLASLEKAMEDPTLLSEAEAPQGGRRSCLSGRTSTGVGRRRSLLGSREPPNRTPPTPKLRPPLLLLGQVVWDMAVAPPRPAKVTDIDLERKEAPYRVHFLDEEGAQAGPEGEVYRSDEALRAVNIKDILRSQRAASALARDSTAVVAADAGGDSHAAQGVLPAIGTQEEPSGVHSQRAAAAQLPPSRPEARAAPQSPPVAGQVVWVLDAGRPPWPGQVLPATPQGIGAAAEPAPLRVRLLGVAPEGAETAVERYLPFASGDANALASVAKEAEALHAEAAVVAPAPVSAASSAGDGLLCRADFGSSFGAVAAGMAGPPLPPVAAKTGAEAADGVAEVTNKIERLVRGGEATEEASKPEEVEASGAPG